ASTAWPLSSMHLATYMPGNAGEPLSPALRDGGAKAGFILLAVPIVNRCFRLGLADLQFAGQRRHASLIDLHWMQRGELAHEARPVSLAVLQKYVTGAARTGARASTLRSRNHAAGCAANLLNIHLAVQELCAGGIRVRRSRVIGGRGGRWRTLWIGYL